jgi:hypothetical protein
MTPEDFGKHYHSIKFKNECHERSGASFQTFFESIMHKHDTSFIAVKPAGRIGDWKCDGFSSSSGTVYQCYAPEGMKIAKAVAKIGDDFAGALKFWTTEMKGWIFVWSAHAALPPQVNKALAAIKKDDKHTIIVDDWSREHLWVIVKGLAEDVRCELLGAIPNINSAPDTTPAEIKALLTFLAARDLTHDIDNLDLTEISQKLQKNGLSDSVRALVTPAVPVARMVQDYLSRHPDNDYSLKASQGLVVEYQRLVASGLTDPDEVFWKMVQYTASGDTKEQKRLWAALGIVSYYFELCDIFQR